MPSIPVGSNQRLRLVFNLSLLI